MWDNVVFKLRRARQSLALSLTPFGAVCAATQRLGVKIDIWEYPMMYASTRVWSSLYGMMRSESETAAQSVAASTSRCLWRHSCLSSACIIVGVMNVTLAPVENCVPSLSESSPSPLEKKKSVSPYSRQFFQKNVRPPFQGHYSSVDSAFDSYRLKMISSRPSATYHTCGIEPLEVMALAGRLGGQENALPSPPGPDSLLSKKKREKNCSLFQCSNIARLVGGRLHFSCCCYILDRDHQQTMR